MKISEFINLSVGEWFSQRTNYNLNQQTAENAKANLTIELLEANHPQITPICQQHQLDSNLIVGSLKHSWDNSVDWGKPKQQGSALIIFLAEEDNTEQGKIIQIATGTNSGVSFGQYLLAQDQALTLTLKMEQIEAQERLWFASDNLRLRTTMVKESTGTMQTAFYSEIRKITQKTQSIPTNAATNA
ncbi:phycobilin lyase, CpcU subunit [Stanieria cyanosphaera PCC 7437]|uniref:Chromophore lyase CpcS/CpeS n=1 Tax=Stanieria cyanosphaera (strain ATCC 29371 / PCC 7437) TaxID=111780 RepID=K9XSV4_STAC7|nr:phycobiliprotein lyase [Stanieria cyanosphaera]AFZ34752.1 phycobilin lyase, CpcU subunit [Stanieria cyanosphaera PCC 7437]